MRIKKFFLVSHVSLFFILMLSMLQPSWLYWLLIFININMAIISLKLSKVRSKDIFLKYLLIPIIMLNSVYLYTGLLVSNWLIFAFLSLAVILSYYYYRSAIKYYRIETDKKKNLPMWSSVFSLLSVFFAGAFLYGLPYFTNINTLFLILVLALVIFICSFQNLVVESDSYHLSFLFSVLLLFSIIPVIWSMTLLPFNYNVLSLIVSLLYYIGLNFIIFYLTKNLSIKKIRYNLLFLVVSLILIFVSVNWE